MYMRGDEREAVQLARGDVPIDRELHQIWRPSCSTDRR